MLSPAHIRCIPSRSSTARNSLTSLEPIPSIAHTRLERARRRHCACSESDCPCAPAHRLHRREQRSDSRHAPAKSAFKWICSTKSRSPSKDLSRYDAIVVGIRAYDLRPDLMRLELAVCSTTSSRAARSSSNINAIPQWVSAMPYTATMPGQTLASHRREFSRALPRA